MPDKTPQAAPHPSLKDKEERSRRARALLHDPLMQELVKALQTRAIQEWVGTNPRDMEAREILWHRVRAVDSLLTDLEAVAKDFDVSSFNNKSKAEA